MTIPEGFHRHVNGGGLVADTANVALSAYIGPDAEVSGDAQVYGDARVSGSARVSGNARVSGYTRVYGYALVSGNAQVYGEARVFGNALVSGNAKVYGSALVSGDSWQTSPLYIQGTRHALTNSKYGYITIGCHQHTFAYWQEHYQAIGRAEAYTKEEIEQYGRFIKLFVETGK